MNYSIGAARRKGYYLCTHDNEFQRLYWETTHLPRVGEDVLLPNGKGDFQEMTVEDVEHYPDHTNVWLGGADGWELGAVTELFEAARIWVGAPIPPL